MFSGIDMLTHACHPPFDLLTSGSCRVPAMSWTIAIRSYILWRGQHGQTHTQTYTQEDKLRGTNEKAGVMVPFR